VRTHPPNLERLALFIFDQVHLGLARLGGKGLVELGLVARVCYCPFVIRIWILLFITSKFGFIHKISGIEKLTSYKYINIT
jgi:hypothetical protein